MNRSSPDPQLGSDGSHGQAFRLLPGNPCDHLGIGSGRTKPHALGPGIGEASLHPVPDHRSLELCEDAHHLEEGAACWSGGVDGLLVEVEVNACAVGLAEKAHEVL